MIGGAGAPPREQAEDSQAETSRSSDRAIDPASQTHRQTARSRAIGRQISQPEAGRQPPTASTTTATATALTPHQFAKANLPRRRRRRRNRQAQRPLLTTAARPPGSPQRRGAPARRAEERCDLKKAGAPVFRARLQRSGSSAAATAPRGMNELVAHRAALLGQPGMSNPAPGRFPQQGREKTSGSNRGPDLTYMA
jgi:hypothetical protein